jgi:hypothetical protein
VRSEEHEDAGQKSIEQNMSNTPISNRTMGQDAKASALQREAKSFEILPGSSN